jgi:hypothetical protein
MGVKWFSVIGASALCTGFFLSKMREKMKVEMFTLKWFSRDTRKISNFGSISMSIEEENSLNQLNKWVIGMKNS